MIANYTDMSDEQLNEVVARIVGYTLVWNPDRTHWQVWTPDGATYEKVD